MWNSKEIVKAIRSSKVVDELPLNHIHLNLFDLNNQVGVGAWMGLAIPFWFFQDKKTHLLSKLSLLVMTLGQIWWYLSQAQNWMEFQFFDATLKLIMKPPLRPRRLSFWSIGFTREIW